MSSKPHHRNAPPRHRSSLVKVAGVMFLAAFILPTLNWVLVLSGLVDSGDASATAQNILAHALGYLLAPDIAAQPLVAGLSYAPSGITELVVGSWLLTRGLAAPKGHALATT